MPQKPRTVFNSFNDSNLIPGELSIDSRFEPYLTDNDLPSSVALREIRSELSGPLTELRRVEKEVQQLDAALALLQKRRRALQEALSVYDPIISPIRNLPDDVLQEIFIKCIPTSRNARPFISESPLLLTRVCKRWRAVAHSTPRLWCTLHVPVAFDYDPPSPRPRAYATGPIPPPWQVAANPHTIELQNVRNTQLKNWLRRSGTLPLSISLFYGTPLRSSSNHPMMPENPPVHLAHELFKIVSGHAHRISHLELNLPGSFIKSLWSVIAPYGVPRMPLLRKLKVSSDRSVMGDSFQDNVQDDGWSILSLPSLLELSVQLPPHIFHTHRCRGSPNLTVLSLHGQLSVGVVQGVLLQSPNLQRFSVDVVVYSHGQGIGYGPTSANDIVPPALRSVIRLQFLETLSIRGQLENIGFLCQYLETPSLQDLRLYPYQMDSLTWSVGEGYPDSELDVSYPPESTRELCGYLSQCNTIRSLTIAPELIYQSQLQSIFAVLPNIDTLVLDNSFTGRPTAARVVTHTDFTRYPDPRLGFSPISFGSFKYNLHPLLTQERVIKSTGQRVPLDQPLLPNLKSFTWNQFSLDAIPDEVLAGFITGRLHPASPTVDDPIDSTQQSTASLKDIKIRLVKAFNSKFDIEGEITRYARGIGLTPGVDFSLNVSTYPWAKYYLGQELRYVESEERSETGASWVSEDNVVFDIDVTWPFFDI